MTEVEKPTDYKKIASALDVFLKANPGTKFLVFGGAHEDEIGHFKIFSDPSVITTLGNHGMHTMAWEAPAHYQPYVENLMQGKVDAKGFIDAIVQDLKTKTNEKQLQFYQLNYGLQVPLILAQDKYGHSFLFYDNPKISLLEHYNTTRLATSYEDKARKISRSMADPLWVDTYIRLQEKGMSHSEENEKRAWVRLRCEHYRTNGDVKAAYDEFRRLRINPEAEKARADYIKAHTVQGAAIWAGSAHGSGFNDLDEYLDAKRIVLIRDRDHYHAVSQRDYTLREQPPTGYLILSEGKIISGEEAFKAAKKFEEGYDRAILHDQSFHETPAAKVQGGKQDLKPK